MIPFLLLIFGLLLIFLEFYLPGAILGTLGALSILGAIYLFASETSSFLAILLFILFSILAVGCVIRFAMWWIVKAKTGYSIYLKEDQEGFQASHYDKTAIGKIGIVVADLKPGGFILIEDQRYPAISLSGYISKGEHVIVLDGQEQSLIVKRHKMKE